jgi:hypothetical protein
MWMNRELLDKVYEIHDRIYMESGHYRSDLEAHGVLEYWDTIEELKKYTDEEIGDCDDWCRLPLVYLEKIVGMPLEDMWMCYCDVPLGRHLRSGMGSLCFDPLFWMAPKDVRKVDDWTPLYWKRWRDGNLWHPIKAVKDFWRLI